LEIIPLKTTREAEPHHHLQHGVVKRATGTVLILLAIVSFTLNIERTLIRPLQFEEEAWGDFSAYYMAGHCANMGYNFYDHQVLLEEARRLGSIKGAPRFIYPPFTALLFMPVAKLMGLIAAFRTFLIFSQLLYWGSMFLMLSIAGLRQTLKNVSVAVILLSWFTPAWTTLDSGQMNMVILFLLSLSFLAFINNKQIVAGIALSMGGFIKLIPGVLFLYFVLRKRWRGIAGMLLAGFILFIISIATMGVTSHRDYVTKVIPERASRIATGNHNVALNSFVYRTIHYKGINREIIANSKTGRQVTLCGRIVLLLLSISLVLYPRSDTNEQGLQRIGLLMITILILSTLTWTHHLVMALPSLAIVVRTTLKKQRPILLLMCSLSVLSYALLAIGYKLQPFQGLKGLPFELLRSSSLNLYGLLIIWILLAINIVTTGIQAQVSRP
jgi:hypothetical protein